MFPFSGSVWKRSSEPVWREVVLFCCRELVTDHPILVVILYSLGVRHLRIRYIRFSSLDRGYLSPVRGLKRTRFYLPFQSKQGLNTAFIYHFPFDFFLLIIFFLFDDADFATTSLNFLSTPEAVAKSIGGVCG